MTVANVNEAPDLRPRRRDTTMASARRGYRHGRHLAERRQDHRGGLQFDGADRDFALVALLRRWSSGCELWQWREGHHRLRRRRSGLHVIVTPDGKILRRRPHDGRIHRVTRFAVARYNPDGSLDPASATAAGSLPIFLTAIRPKHRAAARRENRAIGLWRLKGSTSILCSSDTTSDGTPGHDFRR